MKLKKLELMNEDFLQYLWKTRGFDHHYLFTTQGEPLEIIRPGMHNTDSGPDFFNARIRIGSTLWAGNVEVHLRGSDWRRHKHGDDKAYDNVILHVVCEDDEPLLRSNGEAVPTLELGGRISAEQFMRYRELNESTSWVPCGKQAGQVDSLTRTGWLERLMVERLEQRAQSIVQTLLQNHYDWDESFYQHLARYFGMKVNADPFEWLARTLPYRTIARHRGSLLQVEALLFGQAGLVPESKETYPVLLAREYRILSRKYELPAPQGHLWKFMRLRPVNFPSIRLAQLAALLHHSPRLFSACMETENADELLQLLNVRASGYWDTHYRFGKISPQRTKSLGLSAAHTLLINTVVPFLFVYGRRNGEERYCERALRLLEQLEPEQNTIVRSWAEAGLKADSAFDSQALLQLKSAYCDARRCLHCAIGHRLLKNS